MLGNWGRPRDAGASRGRFQPPNLPTHRSFTHGFLLCQIHLAALRQSAAGHRDVHRARAVELDRGARLADGDGADGAVDVHRDRPRARPRLRRRVGGEDEVGDRRRDRDVHRIGGRLVLDRAGERDRPGAVQHVRARDETAERQLLLAVHRERGALLHQRAADGGVGAHGVGAGRIERGLLGAGRAEQGEALVDRDAALRDRGADEALHGRVVGAARGVERGRAAADVDEGGTSRRQRRDGQLGERLVEGGGRVVGRTRGIAAARGREGGEGDGGEGGAAKHALFDGEGEGCSESVSR